MNLKAYTREHHFYVAIAKHVFQHTEKGIVFVGDPIRLKDAEKFNLKPLLLYGLTVGVWSPMVRKRTIAFKVS